MTTAQIQSRQRVEARTPIPPAAKGSRKFRVFQKAEEFRAPPATTSIPLLRRIVRTILLAITASQTLGPAASADDGTAEIKGVLTQQAEAWNRGDIDAFMEHYWKSDELTFSSSGQTTRGWKNTKEGYQKRYPTREKMGQLTFSQLEITPLGDTAAFVLGRWRLAREDSPIGGNFSLVCRKIDGKWVIIHDHTSRAEGP